ncbi:hypothetical protein Drorol1_Dr00011705 [Drosera rotundifolia]
MIDQLSCSLSQLETLNLTADMNTFRPIPFPILSDCAHRHRSILMWSHLIDASPSLRELKLELDWWEWVYISERFNWGTKATNKIHLCLEDVHMVGFAGCNADVEFATYLETCLFLLESGSSLLVESNKMGREDPVVVHAYDFKLHQDMLRAGIPTAFHIHLHVVKNQHTVVHWVRCCAYSFCTCGSFLRNQMNAKMVT